MSLIGPIDADIGSHFGAKRLLADRFVRIREGGLMVVRAARVGCEFPIARRNHLKSDSSSSEYSLPDPSTTGRFESLVEFIFSEMDDNS